MKNDAAVKALRDAAELKVRLTVSRQCPDVDCELTVVTAFFCDVIGIEEEEGGSASTTCDERSSCDGTRYGLDNTNFQ